MSVLTEKQRKDFEKRKEIARANAKLMARKRGVKTRGSVLDHWKADAEIFEESAMRKRVKK
ncbi:hypothetical protein [Staphylococcus hyicus]|uniref:hypothetical protein n=1 Tax=Staphylococcus hyicus TaxID=1284 RepID=UPI00211C46B2|nr:hypothetical protein [Staphylococcus hyicus]MCQ9290696.1 hypothetical protein [Staphylococcus hyicus]MCQ9305938.1 hypothetical protein [Staphylococcus hyicus]MCQ9308350.1 hypothetical protein [Staphylococcus hyicus]MCQ9310772.1 hypothetical protein [Staphylococcus hyicus]